VYTGRSKIQVVVKEKKHICVCVYIYILHIPTLYASLSNTNLAYI